MNINVNHRFQSRFYDDNHMTLHLSRAVSDPFVEPATSLRENVMVLLLPYYGVN